MPNAYKVGQRNSRTLTKWEFVSKSCTLIQTNHWIKFMSWIRKFHADTTKTGKTPYTVHFNKKLLYQRLWIYRPSRRLT